MSPRLGPTAYLHLTAVDVEDLLGPGNWYRIAKSANLPRSQVSRVLRGVVDCRLSTAVKVAAGAGVRVEELWAYVEAVKSDRK